MAWPSVRLAVEADGREYHDEPDARYRDRHRANDVVLEGWRILRFTWGDVLRRPEWVVAQIRRAITG
jgi:very-short-patch-repair endonuclease